MEFQITNYLNLQYLDIPMSHLIQYFGTECTHCHEMEPALEKIEKELKLKIDRKEVWHDAKNQEEFEKASTGKCPGVPFFHNTKTGKWICGATSDSKLKEWAQGK